MVVIVGDSNIQLVEHELHVYLCQCLSIKSDVKFVSLAVRISAIALVVVTEFGLESLSSLACDMEGVKPSELVSPPANFSPCFSLLQRNDIAMAITKFDQFDFLIDIVPRDELKPPKRQVSWEGLAPASDRRAPCILVSDMLLFLSQLKSFAIPFAFLSLDQIHP